MILTVLGPPESNNPTFSMALFIVYLLATFLVPYMEFRLEYI
jgi:hypothetical protein